MDITIETDHLKAIIATAGAELISLKSKETDIEYIWQADPKYWKRHAPVLFPFVGALKNNQYTYQGKTYQLSQHGFARDMEFQVLEKQPDAVSLVLESTTETKKVYPFDFKLILTYELGGDGIVVKYRVENPSDEEMYFSIGGHPAFNVPLDEELAFEDYFLEPSPMKSRVMLPLKEGFIDLNQRTLGQTNTNIALTRDLFKEDTLIFETKGLNSFSIRSEKSPHSVTLTYNHLPYVGIWAGNYGLDAPFVCIEPWAGIADTLDATGELTEKLGIRQLNGKESFDTKYAITVK
ncbi:aldose 1-epimerase family protein [Enterococcus saccharolyticus]|uniref:Aldose epimerase n=1 Tax=Candidatus Enterococcus willemsii TaxID=1857215 RepID=A0ABQ6Z2W1_9ENTE|nr:MULTISPECIES: aldose 1-epimerase family protein [Enterococcus]KAF1306171.1 aldose epimerase [Enterococcus sp. CU12B]MCD5003325.1 aldose 1-epimerase family protein [Enterococcus saccharolyticus]